MSVLEKREAGERGVRVKRQKILAGLCVCVSLNVCACVCACAGMPSKVGMKVNVRMKEQEGITEPYRVPEVAVQTHTDR